MILNLSIPNVTYIDGLCAKKYRIMGKSMEGKQYNGICPIAKNTNSSKGAWSAKTKYIKPRLQFPLAKPIAIAVLAPDRQK
ncbi:MAG: hypothetical protein ACI8VC_002045 [Candidatus Endobugula sp.]|jgi:hypothetical protein